MICNVDDYIFHIREKVVYRITRVDHIYYKVEVIRVLNKSGSEFYCSLYKDYVLENAEQFIKLNKNALNSLEVLYG
jgi:hypothetical protein